MISAFQNWSKFENRSWFGKAGNPNIEYDLKNKYPHYLIDLLDNTSIFFSNHTPYVCDMVQVLTRQVNELFDAQNVYIRPV